MPDARSPIRHHLVLHRRDPEQGRAHFFSLMIERDLFGTIRLVRNWGPVGTKGQEKNDRFTSEAEALGQLRAGSRSSGKRATPTCDAVGSSRAAANPSVKPGGGRSLLSLSEWRGLSRCPPRPHTRRPEDRES
jgi:predicted DNA-binding WGR domain protein